MNMQQVREKALAYGIKAGKAKKSDLIQHIQTAEGNTACFGSDIDGRCDQTACLWREDCRKTSGKKPS